MRVSPGLKPNDAQSKIYCDLYFYDEHKEISNNNNFHIN